MSQRIPNQSLTLSFGRPDASECACRLEKEVRAYDLLDQLGIAYQRVDHPAAQTIHDCEDVDLLLGIPICKNLFLTNSQKTRFYLLLIPGEKKFRTAVLSKQIGSSRLSFGGPEDMERLLDITPGSVSVLGLMNDKDHQVQLLIDRDAVENREFFACHPSINTSSVKFLTTDLMEKFLPFVGHEPIFVDL